VHGPVTVHAPVVVLPSLTLGSRLGYVYSKEPGRMDGSTLSHMKVPVKKLGQNISEPY
jgi:hypothetical protein